MAASMIDHAAWLLFVWVLGNQAGVPVPVVPSLLAVGALTRSTSLDFTAILGVVVMASLCADLAWYGVGRWRGAKILGGLRRLLPRRASSIECVASLFRAHQLAFLVGARFLPELNPVAASLAGATWVGLARYLVCAGGSALMWAGTWIGLGYLLGEGFGASAALFGTALPVFVAGGLVAAGSAMVLVCMPAIAAHAITAYRATPREEDEKPAQRCGWVHGRHWSGRSP